MHSPSQTRKLQTQYQQLLKLGDTISWTTIAAFVSEFHPDMAARLWQRINNQKEFR